MLHMCITHDDLRITAQARLMAFLRSWEVACSHAVRCSSGPGWGPRAPAARLLVFRPQSAGLDRVRAFSLRSLSGLGLGWACSQLQASCQSRWASSAAAAPPAAPASSAWTPPPVPQTSHCILNFYHLVDVPKPFELLRQHRAFLEGRQVRGRIYISHQGVNAQCGGETGDAVAYVQWLTSLDAFKVSRLRACWAPQAVHRLGS